jgi:hypothetical protein
VHVSALIARVGLNIKRMHEQGPPVSGLPFHISSSIEKVAQK